MKNRLSDTIFQSPDLSDFFAKRYEDVPKAPETCTCGPKHIPGSTYGHQRQCVRCEKLVEMTA